MAPPPKGPRRKKSSASPSPNQVEGEGDENSALQPAERDTIESVCMQDGCIYDRLYEGKDMVPCCHCADWFHVDCIKRKEEIVTGVWPCFKCRTMSNNTSVLTNLIKTLTEAVHKLQRDQEKTAKDIAAKDKQYNELLVQNAELRGRISALYQDASATHWSNLPKPSQTAVIGSSIIRDIDETKLINTQCICISGSKIADVRKKVLEFPTTSKLTRVVLAVGGNDCDDNSKHRDANDLLAEYKDLILCTKEITMAVVVSSICPRRRAPEVLDRIGTLNAGLSVLCDELGATFINNDSSFHLQDGSVSDGYLLPDGVHLTKPATNKLVTNLKLQLRHGEPSAHADHRKGGHPVRSADSHGPSVGITADRKPQSTQRPPQDLAFRRSSPGRAVQQAPQSQPRRAAPSTQARPGRPGATENAREQVTNPGQHWQQQRQQRPSNWRRWQPRGPNDTSNRPERHTNSQTFYHTHRDPSRTLSVKSTYGERNHVRLDREMTCQLCLGQGHCCFMQKHAKTLYALSATKRVTSPESVTNRIRALAAWHRQLSLCKGMYWMTHSITMQLYRHHAANF